MLIIELVGYLAGFTFAVSLLPQVIKSWTTKSTKDISLMWTFTYMTGLSLWIIYGIGIKSYPLTIFASIELLMVMSLIVLKIVYK